MVWDETLDMQINVYGLFRYFSFSFIIFDSGWGPLMDCCWCGNEPSFFIDAGKYLTRWEATDFPSISWFSYAVKWLVVITNGPSNAHFCELGSVAEQCVCVCVCVCLCVCVCVCWASTSKRVGETKQNPLQRPTVYSQLVRLRFLRSVPWV